MIFRASSSEYPRARRPSVMFPILASESISGGKIHGSGG